MGKSFPQTCVGNLFQQVALGMLFPKGDLGIIGTLLAVAISSFLTCISVFRTSNIHTAFSRTYEYPPFCLAVRWPVRFSTLDIQCATRALIKCWQKYFHITLISSPVHNHQSMSGGRWSEARPCLLGNVGGWSEARPWVQQGGYQWSNPEHVLNTGITSSYPQQPMLYSSPQTCYGWSPPVCQTQPSPAQPGSSPAFCSRCLVFGKVFTLSPV